MTDIENRLRQTFKRNLDPIQASRALPSRVRRKARRGRALAAAASVLAAAAAVTAAVFAIPSLGENPQVRPGVTTQSPSPVPVTPGENVRITYSVSTGEGTQLHSIRPDGSDDRRIPTPPGTPVRHAWSPDGSQLALSIFQDNERTIWLMNPDGSDAHQIAAAENVSVPSWSPDGTTIAYSAAINGRSEIHLVSAEGGDDRVIHSEEAEGTFAIFSAKFSPDGTQILFDRGTDSAFDIFVLNVDGRDILPLTTTRTDYDPNWSPDGTKIAFTRQEGSTSDIFVMNSDGSDVRRLTDGGQDATNLYPQWAPDGTKIVYLAGVAGGPGGVVLMNADGSDPVEVLDGEAIGVSWQPLPVSGPGPTTQVFFPTWEANSRPEAIVTGVLFERERCLFLRIASQDALVLWEKGYSYADGTLFDFAGQPVARVGQTIHGGGGYGSDWDHAEQLADQPIPDRCRPSGTEPWVLIYDVKTGPPD